MNIQYNTRRKIRNILFSSVVKDTHDQQDSYDYSDASASQPFRANTSAVVTASTLVLKAVQQLLVGLVEVSVMLSAIFKKIV